MCQIVVLGSEVVDKILKSYYLFQIFVDFCFYSYEAEFIQGLLRNNKKKLARLYNFTFRYIDVLSMNNPTFSKHLDQIYPSELEISGDHRLQISASYIDLFFEVDQEGKLVCF